MMSRFLSSFFFLQIILRIIFVYRLACRNFFSYIRKSHPTSVCSLNENALKLNPLQSMTTAKKLFSLRDFASVNDGLKTEQSKEVTQKSLDNQQFEDSIVIDLRGVVDIPKLHGKIDRLFETVSQKIMDLEAQMLKIGLSKYTSIEEKIIAHAQRESLQLQIDDLNRKAEKGFDYHDIISEILDTYEEIVPEKIDRVIGSAEIQVSAQNYTTFQMLVSDFANLVRKCVDNVTILSDAQSVGNCPKCNGIPIIAKNRAECSTCGHKISLVQPESGSNNISGSGKSDYWRSETFEEYIDDVQGLGKNPVPPEVYETIYTHCTDYGIDTKTLKKSDIRRILQKYGFTDWYSSVNLIANKLTGCPLVDIKKYKDRLMMRHSIFEGEFMAIRDTEGRRNFLQNWYVLFVFLLMEGFVPNNEDFGSLATRDAVVNHDRITEKICARIQSRQSDAEKKHMGWNFIGIA